MLLHILLHGFHLILEDQLGVLLLLCAQLLDHWEFGLIMLFKVFFALHAVVVTTLFGFYLIFSQSWIPLVFNEDLKPSVLHLVLKYRLRLFPTLLNFLELFLLFVLQVHDSVVHLVGHPFPLLFLFDDLVQTCFPWLSSIISKTVKRSLRRITSIT